MLTSIPLNWPESDAGAVPHPAHYRKICSKPTSAAGIDLCVVSNTIHYLRDKTADESLAFLRRWNEYGAEIQQQHGDRIVVFTSTLPCGGAPFLKELERAIVQCGLKGVLINSSHQGAYPTTMRLGRFSSWLRALEFQ